MSMSSLESASLYLNGQSMLWMGGDWYQSACTVCAETYALEIQFTRGDAKELEQGWSDKCDYCREVVS